MAVGPEQAYDCENENLWSLETNIDRAIRQRPSRRFCVLVDLCGLATVEVFGARLWPKYRDLGWGHWRSGHAIDGTGNGLTLAAYVVLYPPGWVADHENPRISVS